MPTDAHRELCARMMVPESDRLARIWELIADEVDARLLLAMPETAAGLAGIVGLSEKEVEERVAELFTRGVVFKASKPAGLIYRSPRHLIQFHDASNQWLDAPVALLDTWKEFMVHEYPALLKLLIGGGFAPFMRTVPNLSAAAGLESLEPFEDLAAMIAAADDLAVCRCPCSVVERECDSPLERCMQVGKGARYVLERGTGKRLTREEALDLLREAEGAGLVHTVESKRGLGTVICSCCTCCCAIIKPGRTDPDCRPILAPSRFVARVLVEECTADGLCVDACPVEAVRIDPDQDVAVVQEDLCIGCGLCVTACPTRAIGLRVVRDLESVPA